LVTLPFVLLLLDFWPLKRFLHRDSATQNIRLVVEKWPFFLLTVAVSIITFLDQHSSAVVPLDVMPPTLRLSNALVSFVQYLLNTIWPVHLAAIYPLPQSIPAWQLCLAVMILGGITWLVWRVRKKSPYALTGWLWFLGTLVPVIGIVQA